MARDGAFIASDLDAAVDRRELRADSAERAVRDYDLVPVRLKTPRGSCEVCLCGRATARGAGQIVAPEIVEEWEWPRIWPKAACESGKGR